MNATKEKTNLPAPAISTGNKIAPIVPANWSEIAAIAGAICRANMAPKSYVANGVPQADKVAIAIMHGMEVGMTPMASLQSLAVINGMPSLYGDGLVAVVRASGQLEDLQEGLTVDKDGKPQLAWCKVKRKGEASWKERSLTWAECQRAGWANKDGPWKLTPGRMMTVRVRGWLLRDMFADVLRGLHSAEEMEDMVDITPVGSATTAPAEPQRSDFKEPTSGPATPHSEGPGEGQPEEKAVGEGAAPSGQPDPKVTDVQDENEKPIEFEVFKTLGAFYDFSDTFLQSAATTPAMARKWEEFYREKIRGLQEHKVEARRTEIADTLALYHAKLKEGEPQ